MARHFFQITDGNQVGAAADRGTETAYSAPPSDGKQNRRCQFTFRNIRFSCKFQHSHCNGTKYFRYHYIRQKNGQQGRCSQPDQDLLFHGSPDTAKGLYRKPFVQPRGRPCHANHIRTQQQYTYFREILADDLTVRY